MYYDILLTIQSNTSYHHLLIDQISLSNEYSNIKDNVAISEINAALFARLASLTLRAAAKAANK